MPEGKKAPPITLDQAMKDTPFGAAVAFESTKTDIVPSIAKDFSSAEIKNLLVMEKQYGFTLSPKEKAFLSENKFLIKKLLDTSIRPTGAGDNDREFVALYRTVAGMHDYKDRTQANAVFYSSDVFAHLYTLILTELVKEMENKEFAPAMLRVSKSFFEKANANIAVAKDDKTRHTWMSVRNYFAVPYSILSNVSTAPTLDDYRDANGNQLDPATVMGDFKKNDAIVDTYDTAAAFAKKLKLDAESEQTVLGDLRNIYGAEGKGVPGVFKSEFDQYTADTGVQFMIDMTQFTPRSHYTNSSLRRQYFRAMTWFIQVPFFIKSPALTKDAFAISELMSEDPQALADYSRMESAIRFIVGSSDDLMPIDYLAALQSAKGAGDQEKSTMEYLIKARAPKIKSMSATYAAVGAMKTDDVILLTKGMRFFSGKFIIDSYWTQSLTQGDEMPRDGYDQKLPPMASSLEVMALLGSDYAKSQIPTLDFYKPTTSKAIDHAMKDLATENAALTDADWQKSLYVSSLWSIRSMFDWLKEHKAALPKFMQSPLWDVKTLETASGFWTEMRHATLLYAKQSFAEKGGGGGECDHRVVPEPPNGFIEPNVDLYDRLLFLAKRTYVGLKEQNFELSNMDVLDMYAGLLTDARDFSVKELADAKLQEKVVDKAYPDYDAVNASTGKTEKCIQHEIEGTSEVENIRLLVEKIAAALPSPVEGPILPAKDRRTSLIADVHTGGDSNYDTHVLYEGIGVPQVLLVMVKDVNGPRVTVGFTYSHYEFTEFFGGKRLTDEDWQKKFYEETEDPYQAYNYTDGSAWPKAPSWYKSILEVK